MQCWQSVSRQLSLRQSVSSGRSERCDEQVSDGNDRRLAVGSDVVV